MHPRYCVGFIFTLASAQVQYGHKLERLPSSCWSEWEDSKCWVRVAHSGIFKACVCRWHNQYLVQTAERKRRHDESRPLHTDGHTNIMMSLSSHSPTTWLQQYWMPSMTCGWKRPQVWVGWTWRWTTIPFPGLLMPRYVTLQRYSYSSTTIMSVLGQSLNCSILTILLTCPNSNTLLCYSNDPF